MKTKQVKFTDIVWDTDGEETDLPTEVTLSVGDDFDIDSDGADLLSDKYGFCVTSFQGDFA